MYGWDLLRSDNSECYDYILLYIDNVLVIIENTESVLRKGIGLYFLLKRKSIGPSKLYLGKYVHKLEQEMELKHELLARHSIYKLL